MFTQKIYAKWMKEKQIQKYEDMKAFLPDLNGLVLDVGCGPCWLKGFLKKIYPRIKYISVDIDSKADIISSGDKLPFGSEIFDAVFCIDTIHLLKNPENMKRVLKQSGCLIISEPKSLWKDNLLNKFKDLKLVKKEIIGLEEKDVMLIFQK